MDFIKRETLSRLEPGLLGEGRLRRTVCMLSISSVRLNGPVLKLALERHADEIRDRVL
jgi:hypothetical protein